MSEPESPVELVLTAKRAELPGGLHVLRALPQARRRMVGPFVFLDQLGPVTFPAGKGIDVRRHPHIGLATVTYLFEGEALHRDSLGSVQRILPGEVNWMVAGRGIAHSERATESWLQRGGPMSGIQLWVALPKELEEAAPSFAHHGAEELPRMRESGAELRVVAGSLLGLRSPVKTQSPLFYAVAELEPGARLSVQAEHEERAVFLVEGELELGGGTLRQGELAVLQPRREVELKAATRARLLLLGGAPLEAPRHIWWNFVSSSRERIEQAKADWMAQRFGAIEGEPEFIPLPADPRRPVNYP